MSCEILSASYYHIVLYPRGGMQSMNLHVLLEDAFLGGIRPKSRSKTLFRRIKNNKYKTAIGVYGLNM